LSRISVDRATVARTMLRNAELLSHVLGSRRWTLVCASSGRTDQHGDGSFGRPLCVVSSRTNPLRYGRRSVQRLTAV
jgi:hypothetical protein